MGAVFSVKIINENAITSHFYGAIHFFEILFLSSQNISGNFGPIKWSWSMSPFLTSKPPAKHLDSFRNDLILYVLSFVNFLV